MRRKILTLFPWVTLVLWLGQMFGCEARNDVLPPLDPPAAFSLGDEGAPLLGVSRSNWPDHVVVVPTKEVEHYPTYTSYPVLVDSTARARGEYPEPAEAVQLPSEDATWTEVVEVPYGIAVAAVDIVLFPIRLFITPPWDVQTSPLLDYERKPEGWYGGEVREEDAQDIPAEAS